MKKSKFPNVEHNLVLEAPIDRWDEAIPLGNGLSGGLLWGSGNKVNLSLDRGDVWDLRTPEEFKKREWNWQTIKKLVATKDSDKLLELFEKPCGHYPYPTKIPVGRLEFVFPENNEAKSFCLDLRNATGQVQMGGGRIEMFFSAVESVGLARFYGVGPEINILQPTNHEKSDEGNLTYKSLSDLGYPKAESGESDGIKWFLQDCAEGFKYAIVVAKAQYDDIVEIAFTMTTSNDSDNPVRLGHERVKNALSLGFGKMHGTHVDWWDDFWSKSAIGLPDIQIERHYYLTQYFYGSASRRGAPPMPLQGVWTADEGTLPPWKGDYHNDLNTELSYWAYLTANRLDEGLCFLDFMWDLLPQFKDFAREFYGTDGACVPGVMSLDGKAMGGWHQYSYSPVNGAWIAHSFYMHWRYTMDEAFLAERAYPFCKEIGECLEDILKPDKNGKLKLPLSSSPEIHGNLLSANLNPNSNYDLSLMRWLFGALAEMADAQKFPKQSQHWKVVLGKLEDLAVEDVDFAGRPTTCGALKVSPDESLNESHRHHSHLMGIYPLGIVNIENSERDETMIANSIRQLDHLGMHFWIGYSFGWMACIAARARQPERALNMLELYLKGFVSRNGFHLNGDFKGLGLSAAQYRPFTLEGNFAAAQAVHEMLLQSWDGKVRIFPSLPKDWQDVSFENLRAEGALLVSAKRVVGKTVTVDIVSEKGGTIRLTNPFDTQNICWSHKPQSCRDNMFTFVLSPGDILKAGL